MARSTLVIVVQVGLSMACAPVQSMILRWISGLSLRTGAQISHMYLVRHLQASTEQIIWLLHSNFYILYLYIELGSVFCLTKPANSMRTMNLHIRIWLESTMITMWSTVSQQRQRNTVKCKIIEKLKWLLSPAIAYRVVDREGVLVEQDVLLKTKKKIHILFVKQPTFSVVLLAGERSSLFKWTFLKRHMCFTRSSTLNFSSPLSSIGRKEPQSWILTATKCLLI